MELIKRKEAKGAQWAILSVMGRERAQWSILSVKEHIKRKGAYQV